MKKVLNSLLWQRVHMTKSKKLTPDEQYLQLKESGYFDNKIIEHKMSKETKEEFDKMRTHIHSEVMDIKGDIRQFKEEVNKKLDHFSGSIDSKAPRSTMFWIFGVLISVMTTLLGVQYKEIRQINDTTQHATERFYQTIQEIKLETLKQSKDIEYLSENVSDVVDQLKELELYE